MTSAQEPHIFDCQGQELVSWLNKASTALATMKKGSRLRRSPQWCWSGLGWLFRARGLLSSPSSGASCCRCCRIRCSAPASALIRPLRWLSSTSPSTCWAEPRRLRRTFLSSPWRGRDIAVESWTKRLLLSCYNLADSWHQATSLTEGKFCKSSFHYNKPNFTHLKTNHFIHGYVLYPGWLSGPF